MNPVERLLQDEIAHLIDRLASSIPLAAPAARGMTATTHARLAEAEAQMAHARTALMEGYGHWRRALEDVENLWALAAWRSTAAEEPSEHPASLAA